MLRASYGTACLSSAYDMAAFVPFEWLCEFQLADACITNWVALAETHSMCSTGPCVGST